LLGGYFRLHGAVGSLPECTSHEEKQRMKTTSQKKKQDQSNDDTEANSYACALTVGFFSVLKIPTLEFLAAVAAAVAAYNIGQGGLERAFAITRANRPILDFDSLVSATTISCTRRQLPTNHGRPSMGSAHSRAFWRHVWGALGGTFG
jgi:hypothetical protein